MTRHGSAPPYGGASDPRECNASVLKPNDDASGELIRDTVCVLKDKKVGVEHWKSAYGCYRQKDGGKRGI